MQSSWLPIIATTWSLQAPNWSFSTHSSMWVNLALVIAKLHHTDPTGPAQTFLRPRSPRKYVGFVRVTDKVCAGLVGSVWWNLAVTDHVHYCSPVNGTLFWWPVVSKLAPLSPSVLWNYCLGIRREHPACKNWLLRCTACVVVVWNEMKVAQYLTHRHTPV